VGNKTECALLGFVNDLGEDYRAIRARNPDTTFTKVFTFNSARKSMSTIIPLEGGGFRIYTKGASEIILKKCAFALGEGGRVDKFPTAMQVIRAATKRLEKIISDFGSNLVTQMNGLKLYRAFDSCKLEKMSSSKVK
jgi:magnesium-transporting ATPase (P-type)